jgi:hypothetical protein
MLRINMFINTIPTNDPALTINGSSEAAVKNVTNSDAIPNAPESISTPGVGARLIS